MVYEGLSISNPYRPMDPGNGWIQGMNGSGVGWYGTRRYRCILPIPKISTWHVTAPISAQEFVRISIWLDEKPTGFIGYRAPEIKKLASPKED